MKLLIVAVIILGVAWWVWSKNRPGSLRPPGTANLDEETALRPEVDPAAVAAARARVSAAVPDELLQDALLDATPQQVARLFAAVPADVMAGALGQTPGTPHTQASAEQLAQLRGAGDAVDDLEIFKFD
jgi:hypothetical protein